MFGSIRRPCRALAVACVLALTSLPLYAQTATAPPPQEKKAAPAELPSAQSLIDRHIAAIGGRDAIAKRQSTHSVGTFSIPANGITGSMEIFTMRPNKMLQKQSVAGIGEIREGFDGTHAWSVSPMTGPMLVTGEELEQKKLDFDFDAILDPMKRYTAMKTVEKTTFDGRDVYKVAMTRKEGGEDIDFYDAETGLKAGSINTRKTQMGTVTVTTRVSDYKKFGALLQPTTLKQSIPGVDVVVTITSVEYDKVDPATFELPAEIKALIK